MASEDGGNEGLSTPKKVVTGAAVGLATAAAVGVGKKLLGSDDSDGSSDGRSGSGRSQTSGSSRSRSTGSTAKKSSGRSSSTSSRAKTSSRTTSRTGSTSSGQSRGRTSTRTKEQLYAQAKRLKIEGRSQMTKAQLERAVARARS